MRIWGEGVCSDVARRVAINIPAIADCRGGVFAVFAKIPPPTAPPAPSLPTRSSMRENLPARFTLREDPPLPVPFLSLPLPKILHDA